MGWKTHHRLPKLVQTVVAVTVLSFAVLPATTSAAAPGDAKVICQGQSIPSGWVVASLATSSCGGSSYTGNAYRIVQIAGRPTGYDTTRCLNPKVQPAGWIITRYVDSYCSTYDLKYDGVAIRNVVGRPAGYTETMCHFSPYPAGWVTTGYRQSSGCTTLSTDRSFNQLVIRNTKGLALGTVLTVCRGSYLVGSSPTPTGWTYVKEVYSAPCRYNPDVPPPATNAFQIKRTA